MSDLIKLIDSKKEVKPWQRSRVLSQAPLPSALPGAKKVNGKDNRGSQAKSGGGGSFPEMVNEVNATRGYYSNYVYYVSQSGMSVLVSKPIRTMTFVDPATNATMTMNFAETINNTALNINQGIPPSIP